MHGERIVTDAATAQAGVPEVERKFDVDDDAIVTEQLGGAGSPFVLRTPTDTELTAVYLDTVDGALARQGVALRRRTGGSDAGWHLKVRLDDSERREVRRPLGPNANRPPDVLLRLVRGVLCGGDVQPAHV